jgi:YidC/Oxa1 family membrane protein insertase
VTVYAGILAPIEAFLEDLLVWIHTNTGLTWAWSIIALTCLVRLAIFPITAKQTRSSLAMQRLQPYMKQLQAKHKDDRQALNAAMMEFYRDNKVNPLASCLPLFIQLPIFFSLFFVLRGFKAPSGTSKDFSWMFGFVGDIRQHISNDMTAKAMAAADPDIVKNMAIVGPILMVIYIGSQMLSTNTMMTSPNPQQKWIFLLLPLFLAPITWLYGFSVGVMLYWITTNLWSLGQYLLVVRLTDTSKEVVLPADSKGRKKVVTPKASNKDQVVASGSDQSSQSAPRRNKRRK